MNTCKWFITSLLLTLSIAASAQIYSPQLLGYNGFGNVFYPYGYYQGSLVNGVAHGIGTFYFRDGTVFQGNFINGWRNGPGVIVNPRYGYVSGCWSNGQYAGNCGQSSNPYSSNQDVRRVVTEANRQFSEDADFVATSPEGYEIQRIDPSSQLGRQLLGSYVGR